MEINMFSATYLRFEEEFYKYVDASLPLPMLLPDFERMMTQKNIYYFVTPSRMGKDGRDHYFYFKPVKDNLIEFDYAL